MTNAVTKMAISTIGLIACNSHLMRSRHVRLIGLAPAPVVLPTGPLHKPALRLDQNLAIERVVAALRQFGKLQSYRVFGLRQAKIASPAAPIIQTSAEQGVRAAEMRKRAERPKDEPVTPAPFEDYSQPELREVQHTVPPAPAANQPSAPPLPTSSNCPFEMRKRCSPVRISNPFPLASTTNVGVPAP